MVDFVLAMEVKVKADQAKAALDGVKTDLAGVGAAAKDASVDAAKVGPALQKAGAVALPAVESLDAGLTDLHGKLKAITGAAPTASQQTAALASQMTRLADYIGMRWTRDFTCWHFCAHVWEARFGIDVPLVEIDGADPRAARRELEQSAERRGWHEVTTPAEGDAVLMAQGARPCHVGIWLSLGGILHCVEGAGAIYTPRGRLSDLGYRVVGYYRRGGA